jgi:AraC-like DNA-binding protein/ligand-binding sensor protein
MKPDDNKNLIAALTESEIYREYARAFRETTGLPVDFRPLESWQLPHHGQKNESAFCAMVAEKSRACAACLQVQQELSETATMSAKTVTCPYGLCDTAVPVRLGDKLIGFLITGQIFTKKPTTAQFEKAAKLAEEWKLGFSPDRFKQAYFQTQVIPSRRYDSIVKLLCIFAEHLSIISNQIVVQRASEEPPMIAKARHYIETHKTEPISLGQVAKAVNMSTFYFCKMFKRFTGMNFTEYLSRVRLEKAKNLLLNRNLNVSEIAYEVGFQSLTHFNRVFKKFVGQSPTEFRRRLPAV